MYNESTVLCPECRSDAYNDGYCEDCGYDIEGDEYQIPGMDEPAECPSCGNKDVWDADLGCCLACGYDSIVDGAADKENYTPTFYKPYLTNDLKAFTNTFIHGESPVPYKEEPYQPFFDLVEKMKKWPFFRLNTCEDSAYNKWHGKHFKWLYKMDVTNIPKAVGPMVFMPKSMIGTKQGYKVLMHEAEHVKDFWKFGVIPFFLMQYILPYGPSFKALFEYRAYVKTMQADYDMYGSIWDETPGFLADALASKGYTYCFPWRGLMKKLFERARKKIMGE